MSRVDGSRSRCKPLPPTLSSSRRRRLRQPCSHYSPPRDRLPLHPTIVFFSGLPTGLAQFGLVVLSHRSSEKECCAYFLSSNMEKNSGIEINMELELEKEDRATLQITSSPVARGSTPSTATQKAPTRKPPPGNIEPSTSAKRVKYLAVVNRFDRQSTAATEAPRSEQWLVDCRTITFDRQVEKMENFVGDQINHNKYLATATRSVVDNFTGNSFFRQSYSEASFEKIIRELVAVTTRTLFQKECFDLSVILNFLREVQEKEKHDALYTASMLILSLPKYGNLVAVDWMTVKNWTVNLAKTVVRKFDEIENDILAAGKLINRTTLCERYEELVRNLDDEIYRKHHNAIIYFRKMGLVSEMCLFILFGLNLKITKTKKTDKKEETEVTGITTDLLVKTTILCRLKSNKSLSLLAEAGDDEKNIEVLWSLPFAYAINLHGVSAVTTVEEETRTSKASLDEFLASAGF